jgi:3-hydroxyisobutyrate dehydrogenase-like beta-hydroxyacid dehydrogenase
VANLGFVGLGVMGGMMAQRLLEKGHTLTGYNRTKSKAQFLIDKGMKWADTPRAVAAAADVTFCSVANSQVLISVVEGPDGVLAGIGRGKFFVDMSTVGVSTSRAVAAKIREKGADMLDSPVSGTVATLKVGKLTLMVGGRKETFEKLKPILEDFSDQPAAGTAGKVNYVGENGLALVMKIATNSNLAVQMLAFSEAVLMAEKSGIPRQTAVEVLTRSVIASPMVQYRGPFVLQLPETAWFDVNMMQKDMLLALELGRQVDVPLPTAAAANEMLTSARAIGLVHEDFAVMFDALAKMSGVSR